MNLIADKLKRLLDYLESDPLNAELIAEATDAALAMGDLDTAETLAARLREAAPSDDRPDYFAGMIGMRRGDFAAAADIFARLFERRDYPNVRFNLAWANAMLGDKRAALALLDAATVGSIAAAATLKIQLIHEEGRFDEAMEQAREAVRLHSDDRGLMAAVATLATDVEDMALARTCAAAAGDHPEGLAVSALIKMEEGSIDDARRLYDRSLSIREHNPRAWIGRGLAALLDHDPVEAARDVDRGAQQFGDHIGSWIAAGWAHCLAGDLDAARQRFEHALAIDHSFAESHGSLAVIDILSGAEAEAQQKIKTALRLDRECFSAVLAQSLLLRGNDVRARKMIDQALRTPLNERGMTIAAYMRSLSLRTIH